ncbi:RICIN domain-containing protein [Nonomuraea sp. NPDC049141]|uniref:RICIN domain-containing protein n=1 Tax=Nonomuraea sp. NPDC049141 TaxID=3155500 RepID=UPI0033C7AF34
MLHARHLLAGAVAAIALSAVTALPAAAAAQQLATHTALAGPPMCLDATNARTNGTRVHLWQCANHTNQKWVIDNGLIEVEDTLT